MEGGKDLVLKGIRDGPTSDHRVTANKLAVSLLVLEDILAHFSSGKSTSLGSIAGPPLERKEEEYYVRSWERLEEIRGRKNKLVLLDEFKKFISKLFASQKLLNLVGHILAVIIIKVENNYRQTIHLILLLVLQGLQEVQKRTSRQGSDIRVVQRGEAVLFGVKVNKGISDLRGLHDDIIGQFQKGFFILNDLKKNKNEEKTKNKKSKTEKNNDLVQTKTEILLQREISVRDKAGSSLLELSSVAFHQGSQFFGDIKRLFRKELDAWIIFILWRVL